MFFADIEQINNTTSDSNPFSFFSDENGTIPIDAINNYDLYTANSYKFQVIEVVGDDYYYAFKITNRLSISVSYIPSNSRHATK